MPRTRPLPGIALALVLALALASACSSPQKAPAAPVSSVWPAPADAEAAARAAGLPLLEREMLDVHYHAHLDVNVRGKRITVPPYIGIDIEQRKITALHTHDATGIIHIESAEDIPFTIGQFFAEWGQPLTTTRVGPITAGNEEQVRVYRNGKPVSGDPAAIKFAKHDQILVWLGPSGENPTVPASYQFPPNL